MTSVIVPSRVIFWRHHEKVGNLVLTSGPGFSIITFVAYDGATDKGA